MEPQLSVSPGSGFSYAPCVPTNLPPRLTAIFTAPAAAEPMRAHQAVELLAGIGIEGDRYALGLGHWSDPTWPDQQITLLESEVAAALGVDAGALRRNLVTSGIRLDTLIGHDFRIGGVLLHGVRHCDPCGYIETLTRAGMAAELAAGRGGLRAAVLEGGLINLGDAIEERRAKSEERRAKS